MSPVNVPSIGAYIREQREQAKISLRQLAQAAGVSNPYLSQVERGLRRPSADILQQIARGLRISAEALYVQAGFLEDRPPDTGVRDAVLSDQDLNERQKQMLLEIYESFRKETAAARTVLVGETVADDEAADEIRAALAAGSAGPADDSWIGEESPDDLWPAGRPWPDDENLADGEAADEQPADRTG
jgi:transcriptional regulator with XRE-family HTH domain